MTPEEALKSLKSKSSSRVQHSLDAIYEICLEQVERGVNDFSAATIARLGCKRSVPKAQSIRNKSGENYRILLQSFSEHHFSSTKTVFKPKKEDAWIDEIKDPKLKFLVKKQAADLSKAKKMIKEIIPPGLEIYVDDRGIPNVEHKLNTVERRALDYAIGEHFLRDNNYTLGKYGDLINQDGMKVFKPGTLDAMKKALEYL